MGGGCIPLADAAPSAPLTTIPVQMLSGMDFDDFPNQTSLAVGKTISLKGLLFNPPGTPTLVTRILRDHQGDGGADAPFYNNLTGGQASRTRGKPAAPLLPARNYPRG